MDVPANVFNWLARLNVMQEGYVASRQPGKSGKKGGGGGTVTLTQQATNAVLSGHAFYYACYNITFSQGLPFTSATLVGNPGDECTTQAASYNWQILADVFGSLGLSLSNDHKDLIVAGDTTLVVDLLRDLYARYSGEAPQPPPAKDAKSKRWASPAPSPSPQVNRPSAAPEAGTVLAALPQREGAVSVDSGLRHLKESRRSHGGSTSVASGGSTRKLAAVGLERSRQKYLAKVKKEQQEAVEREEASRRAEELRLRMTEGIDYTKYQTEPSAARSKYPVFLEFQNRGAVSFCLGVVNEIVTNVETGEAQEYLAQKEQARLAARKAALERRQRGARLVDVSNPVRLTKGDDHRVALMVASIVKEDIVNFALRDGARAELDRRVEERQREATRIESMLTKIDRQLEKTKSKALTYEDQVRLKKEKEEKERAKHEKKMARLRELNRESATLAEQKSGMLREEKAAREKAEEEAKRKKEAEHTLYVAEQKARVVEHRRERELAKAAAAEKKKQDEEVAREERRKIGIALNRKLQEKEQARLKALGKAEGTSTPATLSAFNHGTGDHAAYFGDTLGWQYLTEAEFDIAQMLCQARSDPPSMIPCLEQNLSELSGKSMYYSDEDGRRHPCPMAEGRPALLAAIEYLKTKARVQKPVEDVSIGLTLAARQHATDLAHHGIGRAVHTGTDGSTLTQRVLRYTGSAVRSGCVEMVSSVVRPASMRLGPVDVITRFIAADGDASRASREALFSSTLHEAAGIGHARAEHEGIVVETFVVILSHAVLDKPVAQMAANHHLAIKVVAAPYLDGNRAVHESVRDRRRLMASENVAIGRLTDARPNVEYLSSEKLKRRKYMPAPAAGSTAVPLMKKEFTDASLNPFHDDDDDAGRPAPAAKRERTADEEVEYQRQKAWVERFYRHYAPAKVSIVEDALETFEGRFDELVSILTNKYGPDPPPTPPPKPASPPPQQDDTDEPKSPKATSPKATSPKAAKSTDKAERQASMRRSTSKVSEPAATNDDSSPPAAAPADEAPAPAAE